MIGFDVIVHEIGAKLVLGTKHVMYQQLANFKEKKNTGLKVSSLHINVYCTDQNIMQRGGPHEIEF